MITDNDSTIHHGHRSRMTEKLANHGPHIFNTYELLEMLLYGTIPYKDTNPIAKRLLDRFGSLDGVLTATEDELCTVDGVGGAAAALIRTVGRYGEEPEDEELPPLYLEDLERAGEYLVRFFQENKEKRAAVLFLDNKLRLLRAEIVECHNFGSAAVRPSTYVDIASMLGASGVLITCHHRYGALMLNEGEMATYRAMRTALSDIGVIVGTALVVSGGKYAPISVSEGISFACPSLSYEEFARETRKGGKRNGEKRKN